MKPLRMVASLLFLLSVMLPTANSQSVTGQISGWVTDPTGAVVVGATVQLTHDLSKQVREFKTESSGGFIFTGLMPGTYSLHIAQPGFKSYDQKAITVSVQERVDLHEVRLQVGDVSTSVEVSAQTVHVLTDSSDRTVNLTVTDISNIATRGRNPLALIAGLPGVQSIGGYDFRGWSGGNIPGVNGGQMGQVILNLDGTASQDSGNLNPGYISPSVDALQEVRLLVSNYTAEYGGRSGGQLTLAVKNGTNKFHGGAYYYWRHEMFNANEWFNNKLNVIKPKYRYQNPGGTIGGPLIIPGTNFNKSRTKLFFFFSYDRLRNKSIIDNTFTMPSALERSGDFSQTVTTTGAQVPIYDPLTGQQFPGNKVPASMISRAGQAMLNLFPLPDPRGLALDPTGARRYNFRAILPQSRPNEGKILRMDYNLGSKAIFYARLLNDYQAVDGYAGTVGPPGGTWGQFEHSYHVQSAGAMATLVYSFSPTLINEFTWGVNRGKQGVNPLDRVDSTATGGAKTYADSLLPLKDSSGAITLPRINQASNVLNLLPAVIFGFPTGFSAQSAGQGVTNAPVFQNDPRWPFTGTDMVQSISGKVTWIKGPHSVKAGIYIERMARNVSVYSVYNAAGTYYFGSDRSSPFDTGYPYSNALLGSIFAYGDDNKKQVNHARYTQIEWFGQDTWKVTRRLTLDYGARFHRVGDLYSKGATLGLFRAEDYNASKVGQLLYPACSIQTTGTCPTANKIALNRVTGATFPYVRQGTFDTASYPAGGMPFSGIHQYDSHFFKVPPIKVAPRLGFALDVFGNGKTALRGGFGVIVGRNWTVDSIGALAAGRGPMMAPPNFQAPTILYTNFASLAGSQPYLTPQDIVGGSQDQQVITTYNWSFGVQQDIGRRMIVDVSYVANSMRHGFGYVWDYNAVPPYTTWNPKDGQIQRFRDPTSTGFYSTNLIRAMVGYAGIGMSPGWSYLGASSYNALQVQVNRRVGKLQWNLNYTWQKTLVYPGYNAQCCTSFQWVPLKLGRYDTNRPHAVNVSFGYEFPKVSRFWSNAFTKQALDRWRLSGNVAIFSGSQLTVGCSATNQPAGYWTGTPTQAPPFRCQMGNSVWLPEGQYPSKTEDSRLQYRLNAANFALPPADSLGIGNTPLTLFFGPGVINFDLALSKDFRLTDGGKSLEFRVETFNTFNHFNPGNPNTSLTLNYVTGAQTNASYGVISGAQVQARRAILSLRFTF